MIPQPEQHIKCIFKNGTIVEGIVKEWGINSSVILQSLTDQSLMIILHPKDDIMMIKIMAEQPEENLSEEIPDPPDTEPEIIQQQIRAKLKELERPMESLELQNKTIADLKKLAIEQDKQIMINKIKEHFPNSPHPQKSNYTAQSNVVLDRKPYKNNV